MRATAVCDACFGMMAREDRTHRLRPATILYKTTYAHPPHISKGHSTAVYYAHLKITTSTTIRMTLIMLLAPPMK